MTPRKTGSLPSLSMGDWKAWAVMAVMFITPPAAGGLYAGGKFDNSMAATQKNTEAINELRLAMEGHKLTEHRLGELEKRGENHEKRLLVMEQSR